MWDQKVISITATFVGITTALLFTPVIWQGRRNLDERLVAFWFAGWCLGLGSLVNIDQVYLFVGQISHIPNLGWLVEFWLLVPLIHCAMIIASRTLQVSPSDLRILAYITVTFLIVLTLIFFLGGIAFSLPEMVRANARSLAELVYMDVVYLYEIAIFCRPWILSVKMLSNSHSLESRIRSTTLFAVLSASITYCVLRTFKTVVIYYSLVTNAALINAVQMVLWITFAIALLLWPVVFIPTQWFEFFRQIERLYHLNYLYKRVCDDCGQSLGIHLPKWWVQVKQAAFYTNAIGIFVLDIKWLLNRNRLMIHDRDLAEMIESLDDSLPQKQFIAECVGQSRNLRRQAHLRMRKAEIASYGR